MIKGITFDLWDTVFVDDSDEPKRKAAGRPTKVQERKDLFFLYISKHADVKRSETDRIFEETNREFRKAWYDEFVTWSVDERLQRALNKLHANLPKNELNLLVKKMEEMELEFRPDFASGVEETIRLLHKKYKLGVISDTIFSPGTALRELLKGKELLKYFTTFIFSDEAKHSKPHPSLFQAACKGLQVKPSEWVHIGDREAKDIEGPKAFGGKAILCTVVVDRGSEQIKADAKFNNYADLPKEIEKL